MKITNEFTVQIPIDQAWKVLTDLEGIAPCMPGAQLTGVEGEVYKGKVKVKVGPVISDFAGTAQFTAKDDEAYRAVIDAKGRDARSAGNASATVSAALTAETPTSTKVSVDTDLKISGKLAQFGSGMIKEVSSKLLTQFVTNLESKLATDAAPAAPATGSAPAAAASAPAVSASPENDAADAPAASTSAATAAASVDASATPAASTTTSSASSEPATPPASSEPARSSDAATGPSAAAASVQTAEPEAIDLLAVAGSSIYKRVIPVAVGAVVVVAVIVWFVARG
ncbi:SRPBCC family protein [Actinoplanes sp. NPDC026670]|uniref:SRPBCC family protein n=1 Tax=Actinoplanes sp. NPDC026670 TaxID=3154700 RepID=UPI003401259B